MREHPIPQDITGYKFHIIGSMTLKQFTELGIAAVLSFLTYGTNLPIIIKWPIIIIFVILGVVAAFVPINERPLDRWIIIFLNVLYKPTQFYWRRIPKIPSVFNYVASQVEESEQEIDYTPIRRRKIKEYMDSMKTATTIEPEPMDIQEDDRLTEIMKAFDIQPALEPVVATPVKEKPDLSVRVRSLSLDPDALQSLTTQPQPDAVETHQPDDIGDEEAIVAEQTDSPDYLESNDTQEQQELQEKEDGKVLETPGTTQEQYLQYSDQEPTVSPESEAEELDAVFSQEQETTHYEEILETHSDTDSAQRLQPNQPVEVFIGQNNTAPGLVTEAIPQEPFSSNESLDTQAEDETPPPPIVTVFSSEEEPDVIPEQNSVFTSNIPPITAPKIANQIKGIVTDAGETIITDAVIKILDEDGAVERAVSTNALGQFSITTPLPDGEYTLVSEKPGYQFQPLKVVLEGNITPPLTLQAL